jgi:5-methylcytosine-specific restriction endonuclease McrA
LAAREQRAAQRQIEKPRERKNSKMQRVRFERSPEWIVVRNQAFELYGRKCHKCGSTERLNVDHIKPESRYPELALSIENTQILCWPCNRAKSNKDETDYR